MPVLLRPGIPVRVHPTLPIFRVDDEAGSVLYAPGLAQPEAGADIEAFERRAREAVDVWRAHLSRPFEPECLTVLLSNACNAACAYCYSAPRDLARRSRRSAVGGDGGASAQATVSEAAVAAAAALVADHCAARGRDFALSFHGGGEPTLHWALLVRLHERVGALAATRGLPLWSHVATNGVVSERQAAWLAEHVSLVGLSCDGPSDLHDRQRPAASGGGTSAVVERTARVLADAGASFHVRATITRAALGRQPEIASYLAGRLGARVIRFEPAYQPRGGEAAHLPASDAEDFVEGFLDARRVARRLGAELLLSGVRLDEIHGPYCHPLRDVLQVGPGDTASACFLTADGDRPEDAALTFGAYDCATDRFTLDLGRVARLRRSALAVPPHCRECFNQYHCARDCPDVCVVAEPEHTAGPGLRCRVHQLVAAALIRERARDATRSIGGN